MMQMTQENVTPQVFKVSLSPNQTVPSTSNFQQSEPEDLHKVKNIIHEALQGYQVEEIKKMLVKVAVHVHIKEVIAELAFAEWQFKEKEFKSCDCCQCSFELCRAMDKGDDMVYIHLKDCPRAYVKSEARLAWQWLCYSVALPCLCVVVVPVFAYAGICYCRGCLPNIFSCGCPDGQKRDQEAQKQLTHQLISKLRKLQSQCKAYL